MTGRRRRRQAPGDDSQSSSLPALPAADPSRKRSGLNRPDSIDERATKSALFTEPPLPSGEACIERGRFAVSHRSRSSVSAPDLSQSFESADHPSQQPSESVVCVSHPSQPSDSVVPDSSESAAIRVSHSSQPSRPIRVCHPTQPSGPAIITKALSAACRTLRRRRRRVSAARGMRRRRRFDAAAAPQPGIPPANPLATSPPPTPSATPQPPSQRALSLSRPTAVSSAPSGRRPID